MIFTVWFVGVQFVKNRMLQKTERKVVAGVNNITVQFITAKKPPKGNFLKIRKTVTKTDLKKTDLFYRQLSL